MNLNVSDWKRFILGRLFDIKKGKRLTSEDQEDGDNLYIGAIDSNNGVANHISQTPIHKGNTISLSYNGSVGEAFYQPEPYWATDDVNALYSKYEGFNEPIGLFIAATIRQEKYRFSYGRKWTLDNMNITEICLPVKHNADGSIFFDDTKKYSDDGYVPDWQFMEDYIKSLHHKPLTTKNKSGQVPDLNVQDWKEFSLYDYFDVIPGKYHYPEEYEEGTTPYYSASNENNGIGSYIDLEADFEGNKVVTGKVGCTAFYAPEAFCATSDVNIFCPRFNMSPYVGLFVATVVNYSENYKWAYGRQCRVGNSKRIKIKLPVDANGNPDWQFMEDYIKALPYGDRVEG